MNATAKQQLRRNVTNDPYSFPTKTYSIPSTTNEDGTINIPAQPVYGIDPNHEPIDAYMAVRTTVGGLTAVTTFTAGIAGGVGFTVPANKKWELQSFISDTTMTATVGNRTILLRILSAAGQAYWVGTLGAATTAAQVCGYDIGFGAPINTPSTTVRRNIANTGNTNVQVRESCSAVLLPPGSVLQLIDVAGIDGADSAVCRLIYTEYDV